MKIRRFECEKIHGYLSFALKFNDDLTFITGINGSGKTSAVRAVTSLLTPSIRDLANLSYKHVRVSIDVENQELTIQSQRTDDEIVLQCSEASRPLRIPVLRQEAYEPPLRFFEREHDFYREQEAVNARNETLLAISRLPTPMFLDLERRHQGGTIRRPREARFLGRTAPANPLSGSVVESLQDAKALAEHRYRQVLADRSALTDRLKHEIILTAFALDEDEARAPFNYPTKKYLKSIEDEGRTLRASLSQIGIAEERIAETLQPFFNRVLSVASQVPSPKELAAHGVETGIFERVQAWASLQPRVRQANRLMRLIDRYNGEVKSLFEPVERYSNSINAFLHDSGKELKFDQAGNLQVLSTQFDQSKPINALSSGERQLVVILTHLAFNPQAQQANVLIIDEPELSLHLRWQELFVDAVTDASPGIQLILATHSPSIIKSRIANCVDIEEARRDDQVLP